MAENAINAPTNAQGKSLLAAATQLAQAQVILNNVAVSAATVAATDKILGLDVDDAGNLKSFTAQSIANLALTGGAATTALDNLAAVAINTSLISDTDLADDLGAHNLRWDNLYAENVVTGRQVADQLILSAYDVDGAAYVDFITLTANNTPTCVLSGDVTGVTQSASDNSTKLATTAYVDAATGGGTGANDELSNLAATAINTTLKSDGDLADDLGAHNFRWDNLYVENIVTGQISTNALYLSAYDVDGAAYVDFITLTAGNTPTCALSGDVTGVTQTASDNSTKLATTAYTDTQATTAITAAIGTTVQAYDAGLTSIAGLTTVANNLIYTTASDTYAVIAPSASSVLVTNGSNVPSLSTAIPDGVTATTQTASDNSTKLATTAYVDAAMGSGGGSWVFLASATASASASLTFTSSIDSTYDHYVFVCVSIRPTTDGAFLWLRTSTNGGSSYDSGASDYEWNMGSQGGNSFSSGDTKIQITYASVGIGNAAGEAGYDANVTLCNPSATLNTQVRTSGAMYRSDSFTADMTGAGVRKSAADVDAVQFLMSTSTIASGSIYMYGIKKS